MKKMKQFIRFTFLLILVFSLMVQCKKTQGGPVKLEFFHNKREAVEVFEEFIQKFQQENPGIEIEQNFTTEAETVLRSRMVKNDIPDILGLGGNFTYGEVSKAGVLEDFTNDPMVKKVHQAYVEMIGKLAVPGKVHGIPYSANANTVIYNKDKFEKLGLKPPETWDDFIKICNMIKDRGEVPLYFTLLDSWTALVPFNSVAANIQSQDFIEKRKAQQTSFADQYPKVAQKMLQLLDYGHDDNFGIGYDDGNNAFANGKSYMLIQGIWAINPIKNANPNINIGVFGLPVKNSDNRLVSGVDTVLTISSSTPHKEAAKKFLAFLLKPVNSKYYIDNQRLFSAVKGIYQEDPELIGIRDYFKSGMITSFPDHYYPSGMQINNLVLEFLVNKNEGDFLNKLDEEWDKVVARQ